MRHGKRHLPKAVSTVLGLAAPALAAMLLTSTTPGLAAVATAPAEQDVALHIPTFVSPPAPVVRRTVAKPVVAPARKVIAPRQVVRATSAPAPAPARVPAPRRTTRATAAPKPTATKSTSTTSQTAQPWGANDYPYRTQSDYYATDKWGFTQRQCVSFAAWRLAQHGRTINNRDNWGSAYTWDDAARRLGHTVTSKARVGAIAHWNANESGAYYSKGSATANGKFSAGGYGHVGWVKQVYSDGSALVEQYNMGSDRSYSAMRVKAPRYLLVG
ncbi:MAG TPA: CHAP domain-containing protein [Mycobacteriales bacterium]|nr:CHAP domain-containing protein [Mycobacteriales bacterium]